MTYSANDSSDKSHVMPSIFVGVLSTVVYATLLILVLDGPSMGSILIFSASLGVASTWIDYGNSQVDYSQTEKWQTKVFPKLFVVWGIATMIATVIIAGILFVNMPKVTETIRMFLGL